MVELQDDGIRFVAIDAGMLQQVLEQPLLIDVDGDLLSTPRLGLVVLDVSLVVVFSILGPAEATA
jgi:hypothetical protein